MRALFRIKFQDRYQEPWRDVPAFGMFLLDGGIAPWVEFTINVGSAEWQRSTSDAAVGTIYLAPSSVLLSCQHQALSTASKPCLKKGTAIRIGSMGVDCFTTTIKRDTGPPLQFGDKAGKITVVVDGVIPEELDSARGSNCLVYVLDRTVQHAEYTPSTDVQPKPPKDGWKTCACCGTAPCKYLPTTYVKVRVKDGHSRKNLEKGDLRGWDVTTLRIPLAGMLPPIPRTDPPGQPCGFLEGVFEKDKWKDPPTFKKAVANQTLKPKDAVQYAVLYCKNAIVSHTVMCQVNFHAHSQWCNA